MESTRKLSTTFSDKVWMDLEKAAALEDKRREQQEQNPSDDDADDSIRTDASEYSPAYDSSEGDDDSDD